MHTHRYMRQSVIWSVGQSVFGQPASQSISQSISQPASQAVSSVGIKRLAAHAIARRGVATQPAAAAACNSRAPLHEQGCTAKLLWDLTLSARGQKSGKPPTNSGSIIHTRFHAKPCTLPALVH